MTKFTKNDKLTLIKRISVLVVFALVIAAVLLYEAGAYDVSFIKRQAKAAETESKETEEETEGETTVTVDTEPPDTDDPELYGAILDAIKKNNGEEVYTGLYSTESYITRLDFGANPSSLIGRNETVLWNEIYKQDDQLFGEHAVEKEITVPALKLYFGFILVDNGETYDIYDNGGNLVLKGFDGELLYEKTADGFPAVKSEGKYYKLTKEGLSKISGDDIVHLALAFDYPEYYAEADTGMIPYMDYELVFEDYIPETDEKGNPKYPDPPTTESETTEPEETTEEGETSETDGEPTETEPDETTESETTEGDGQTQTTETEITEETTEESTEPPLLLMMAEGGETTEETTEGTTESDTQTQSDTESNTDESDTETDTDTDTETETETEAEETFPTDAKDGDLCYVNGKWYVAVIRPVWGFKNSKGEVVVPAKYKKVYNFTSDGVASVIGYNDEVIVIDKKGKEVINRYIEIRQKSEYLSHARVWPRRRHAWALNKDVSDVGMYYFDKGYCMVRYLEVVHNNVSQIYVNEYRIAKKGGGYFDVPGNYSVVNYSDGVILLEKAGKYGYLSVSGKWVKPAKYTEGRPFLQGLAVVRTEDGKYGMINLLGEYVLPPLFDYVSDASSGVISAFSTERGWEIFTVNNGAKTETN